MAVHTRGFCVVVARKVIMKLIRVKSTPTTKCYIKEGYRDMEVKLRTFLAPDKGEWPASCCENLVPLGKDVVVALQRLCPLTHKTSYNKDSFGVVSRIKQRASVWQLHVFNCLNLLCNLKLHCIPQRDNVCCVSLRIVKCRMEGNVFEIMKLLPVYLCYCIL